MSTAPRSGALRRAVLTGALIAATCLAACSGGGDPAPSGPTKEAYLEQALPICDATQARIDEAAADLDQSTLEGRTAYVSLVAEEVLATVAQLRALEAPSADAAALEQAFATYERRFGEWLANPEIAVQGAVSTDLTAAARELADYGLGPCGSGGS